MIFNIIITLFKKIPNCARRMSDVIILIMGNLDTTKSLTQFFYQSLDEINKKCLCPLPQEFILYSSEVLNQYSLTGHFFNETDSGINEKILGINFLEAQHKSDHEKKKMLKDVGDSVLVQLGFFKSEQKRRSPSRSYYLNLGKSAYIHMENLECRFYDIPNFYHKFATSLDAILNVIKTASEAISYQSFEEYLIHQDQELNSFLIDFDKKVS